MSENSKSVDNNLPNASRLNGASFAALPGEEERLLSMHEASKMTGYHQDYLGQVARSGKLKARKMGRNWFTTKLAVDMFLGRVPDPEKSSVALASVIESAVEEVEVEEAIAPVMETVVTPIANFQPVVPVVAQVMKEVSQSQKIPAIQINIVRPEPEPQEIFAEAPILTPKVERSRKVTVNILSMSPDAGPNLQEAIAIPQPERVTLPPNLDLDNKNKYHRLSKLVASRRVSRSRAQSSGNFFPATVPARMFPVPAMAGLAALLVTVAAGSAYYFSGALAEAPQQQAQVQEQVAGASTSAVGKGRIKAGQTRAVISNDSVDPSSVILVSLRSDQPGRHWITGQSEGHFTLMLTEPATQDVNFDYWVAPGSPEAGGGPRE